MPTSAGDQAWTSDRRRAGGSADVATFGSRVPTSTASRKRAVHEPMHLPGRLGAEGLPPRARRLEELGVEPVELAGGELLSLTSPIRGTT